MKKYKKIITILTIIIFIISISNIVFGATTWTDQLGKSGQKLNSENDVKDVFKNIITVVQVIGVGIAVIMLLVLGIKFMYASPNEKADIKKHAIIYSIGAIIFFGTTGLIELLKDVIESLPS